jgi:hypothetical protein
MRWRRESSTSPSTRRRRHQRVVPERRRPRLLQVDEVREEYGAFGRTAAKGRRTRAVATSFRLRAFVYAASANTKDSRPARGSR